VAEEYEVTEIKTFQSVAYPAAGRYRRLRIENIPALNYEFSVVSVEALTEEARKDWFPDWPAGTRIGDLVSGKNRTIPPKIVEMSKEELGAAAQEVELGQGASSTRLPRVIIAVSVLVIVLVVWRWRRARRRRAGTG